MTANEMIRSRLLQNWPESWKLFEESCKYSLKNNLEFIKGVLLSRESKIDHSNATSIREQLYEYLTELGYKNIVADMHMPFFTKKGHEHGLVFIVFLSSAAIKDYIAENEKWNKWASFQGSILAGPQPPRPIYELIRYLNIYKNIKK